MRGNEPYVRGLGLAPMNVESVPTIPTGWATNGGSVSRPRPARDLVDAEVLGEQQVADDVDRVVPGLGHDLGHGPRLPAQEVRPPEGPEADVRPAGGRWVRRAARRDLRAQPVAGRPIGQSRLERSGPPAWIQPRQLDEQPRARPLGRVGVEGDVEALGAGVVDQLEHRSGPPGVGLAVIEVGDVGRRPARRPISIASRNGSRNRSPSG